MKKPRRLFKNRPPVPLVDLHQHVRETKTVKGSNMDPIVTKLRADLDALEWPADADAEALKLACANATLNMLINESRHGFGIPAVGEVVRKGRDLPLVSPIPDDLILLPDIERWFSNFILAAFHIEGADHCRLSCTRDGGKGIFLLVVSLSDLVSWTIEGKIEGASFVRTHIGSVRPTRPIEAIRVAALEGTSPPLVWTEEKKVGAAAVLDYTDTAAGCAFTTTAADDPDELAERIRLQPWSLDVAVFPGGVVGICHRPDDARVAVWLKEHGLPVFPVEMNLRREGDKARATLVSPHLTAPLELEARFSKESE